MKESQRMEDALVLQVFLHLLLDRSKTGKDISMCVNNTLRIAGRAGGEHDLHWVRFAKSFDGARYGQRKRGKVLKNEAIGERFQLVAAPGNHFRINFLGHAMGERFGASEVDRHGDYTPEYASKKRADPGRP